MQHWGTILLPLPDIGCHSVTLKEMEQEKKDCTTHLDVWKSHREFTSDLQKKRDQFPWRKWLLQWHYTPNPALPQAPPSRSSGISWPVASNLEVIWSLLIMVADGCPTHSNLCWESSGDSETFLARWLYWLVHLIKHQLTLTGDEMWP